MTILEICLRIVLAMVIGGVIGWERETSNRPAGFRTHILVSVGAAVVMIMGQLSFDKYGSIATIDPTRLGAQVISGIGFLGAGTILREGMTIKGLTTAASLWAVACLGLAVGGGFYVVAVSGTIAIMLTLTIFEYLEKKFMKVRGTDILLEMSCKELSSTLINIKKKVSRYEGILKDVEITEEEIGNYNVSYHLTCKLHFEKTHKKKTDYHDYISEISSMKDITNVRFEEI